MDVSQFVLPSPLRQPPNNSITPTRSAATFARPLSLTPSHPRLLPVLQVLQHRGQDAAGMVTASTTPGSRLNLKKSNGLVKEVFQQKDMEELQGNIGTFNPPTPFHPGRACYGPPIGVTRLSAVTPCRR